MATPDYDDTPELFPVSHEPLRLEPRRQQTLARVPQRRLARGKAIHLWPLRVRGGCIVQRGAQPGGRTHGL